MSGAAAHFHLPRLRHGISILGCHAWRGLPWYTCAPCGAVRLLAFRDLRAGTKATGTRTATYAPKSWLLPRAIGVRLNRKKTVANPLSLPPVYAHGTIYPGPSAQGRTEGPVPYKSEKELVWPFWSHRGVCLGPSRGGEAPVRNQPAAQATGDLPARA